MASTESVDKGLLYKLIQSSTSIAVVSDFLKRKQLTHSASSWDDMFALRLDPALADSKISIAELVDLLRTVEEVGSQHVFLFKCKPETATELMDRRRITEALASLGLSQLLTSPNLYDFPEKPSIADVRWVTTTQDTELVIKEIQTKEHYKLASIKHTSDGMLKEYTKLQERGVNIGRLHRNGNLEIRIAARTGSMSYRDDLLFFRKRIENLIPMIGFAQTPLRNAKDALWNSRALYDGRIRYSEIAARNDDDYVLKATGGSLDSNVSSNQASVNSLQSFIQTEGRCESFNLWFSKAHTPSKRDVHFVLSGEVNEFAINSNCTLEDYEYVLSELRALNA